MERNMELKEGDRAHRSGFVALVGPANAGKSTLLNQFVGQKISIVSPKEQTTRNRILGIKTIPDAQIVFLDTPGFLARRYRGELAKTLSTALKTAIEDNDLAVLVIDSEDVIARPDGLERIVASVRDKKIKQLEIIAINKVDLVDKRALLPVLAKLDELFSSPDQTVKPEFIPVSALRGEGLAELEQAIVQRLPEGPAYFPDDMITDQPEHFLAAEVIREKLMLHLQKELPYSLTVAVEDWEESDELLKIKAVVFVERSTQKPIVIGKNGEMLKKIGTSARLELEKLFDIHVFLELFVKVEPNWTKTRRGLHRAGVNEGKSY